MKNLDILVGTYDSRVFSYRLINQDQDSALMLRLCSNVHQGSVQTIACEKKFAASGSSDETIQIINLVERIDDRTLSHHDGTITCLEFHGDYLLSGSADGNIFIWYKKTWQVHKILSGHKHKITAMAVHPSGKLMLSAGKDNTLRTWNLIKGRPAYVINLKTSAEIIEWSPEGSRYAVGIGSIVDVYDTNTAGIIETLALCEKNAAGFQPQVHCVTFLSENVLAMGGERDYVMIHDLRTKKNMTFKAHNSRVQYIKSFMYEDERMWLATASTDGCVSIWHFQKDDFFIPPTVVVTKNIMRRVTALDVWVTDGEEKSLKSKQKNGLLAKSSGKVQKSQKVRKNQVKRKKLQQLQQWVVTNVE